MMMMIPSITVRSFCFPPISIYINGASSLTNPFLYHHLFSPSELTRLDSLYSGRDQVCSLLDLDRTIRQLFRSVSIPIHYQSFDIYEEGSVKIETFCFFCLVSILDLLMQQTRVRSVLVVKKFEWTSVKQPNFKS